MYVSSNLERPLLDLSRSVDGVALCLLTAEPVELAEDLALQIHFTLLQAFCAETEIAVALLTEPARLNALLPVDTDGAPRDCHCVLISVSRGRLLQCPTGTCEIAHML